jgi:hypothetical protein
MDMCLSSYIQSCVVGWIDELGKMIVVGGRRIPMVLQREIEDGDQNNGVHILHQF